MPGPVVLHDELDLAACALMGIVGAHGGVDGRSRGRVADGVLDQVGGQAVQVVPRPLDDRAAGVDRDRVPGGDRLELGRRLGEHLAEVRGLAGRDAAGVGAGEQEQVGDEPAHPLGRAQGAVRGVAQLALIELDRQQLEVREHAGQRRAQLVRGVGHEGALVAQRRLGLRARVVERLEHALQRACQLGHLVIGLGMGDVPARVARSLDLARRRGQLGDRAHGPPRHREPGEQRQERSPATPRMRKKRTLRVVWRTSDSGRAYSRTAEPSGGTGITRDSTR